MVVLDASTWLNVLAGEKPQSVLGSSPAVFPPHFDVEVIGGIRRMLLRELITKDQAERAVDLHRTVPFCREEFSEEDMMRAWGWRHTLSFADAWYAALARRLRLPWVTSDERAARGAERLGVAVVVR